MMPLVYHKCAWKICTALYIEEPPSAHPERTLRQRGYVFPLAGPYEIVPRDILGTTLNHEGFTTADAENPVDLTSSVVIHIPRAGGDEFNTPLDSLGNLTLMSVQVLQILVFGSHRNRTVLNKRPVADTKPDPFTALTDDLKLTPTRRKADPAMRVILPAHQHEVAAPVTMQPMIPVQPPLTTGPRNDCSSVKSGSMMPLGENEANLFTELLRNTILVLEQVLRMRLVHTSLKRPTPYRNFDTLDGLLVIFEVAQNGVGDAPCLESHRPFLAIEEFLETR